MTLLLYFLADLLILGAGFYFMYRRLSKTKNNTDEKAKLLDTFDLHYSISIFDDESYTQYNIRDLLNREARVKSTNYTEAQKILNKTLSRRFSLKFTVK